MRPSLPRMLSGGVRLAACAAALAWLGACSLGGGFSRQKDAAPSVPDRPQQDLSPIAPLLEMMSSLPQGGPRPAG